MLFVFQPFPTPNRSTFRALSSLTELPSRQFLVHFKETFKKHFHQNQVCKKKRKQCTPQGGEGMSITSSPLPFFAQRLTLPGPRISTPGGKSPSRHTARYPGLLWTLYSDVQVSVKAGYSYFGTGTGKGSLQALGTPLT